MKIRHSKYKNTAFLFELLVRRVTSDILAGTKTSLAESLLKKYFNPKTELGKEYRLYESLIKERYNTEYRADKFVDKIVEIRLKLDNKKINTLKYNLIKEIKEKYDIDQFFKYPMKNYKLLASIYTLFEGHINPKYNEIDTFNSKNTIVENIYNSDIEYVEDKKEEAMLNESKDLRALAQKIMIDKFNEKYAGLNEHQKSILSEYISNITDNTVLKRIVSKEVPYIVSQLENLSTQIDDQVTSIKLKETIHQLNNMNKKKYISDHHITSLLISHELIKELEDKL